MAGRRGLRYSVMKVSFPGVLGTSRARALAFSESEQFHNQPPGKYHGVSAGGHLAGESFCLAIWVWADSSFELPRTSCMAGGRAMTIAFHRPSLPAQTGFAVSSIPDLWACDLDKCDLVTQGRNMKNYKLKD